VDDDLVCRAGVAFRVRVVSRPEHVLLFEALDWPSANLRGAVSLPYPDAGYGGSVLAISPRCTYAAALLYSGQSELGYELFALAPALKHIGAMPYVLGESDLSPPTFSPDETLVAIVVGQPLWWVDPQDDDADDESPAAGGVVHWATLLVHRLGELEPSSHPVRVDLPRGWHPDGDMTRPGRLRFDGPDTLTLEVPWAGAVSFGVPEAREAVLVPSPTV
jgi:hypothetical protein